MQIQRTVLWIVFAMSLLFLWDGWQKYNGRPSLFGGPATTQQAQGPSGPAGPGKASDTSIPSASPPAAAPQAAAASTVPGGAGAAAAQAPLVNVRNDVLALTIDPVGGQVRRAELLAHRNVNDAGDKGEGNVVLLEDNPVRKYVAESGLIGAPQGTSFPTHRTLFTVAQGPRELAPGSKSLVVTMTAESGGLRLTRTYTLERGSYVVQVRDEVTNVSPQPLSPTLYMQLVRDSGKPEGQSRFYSTYTGPVLYTDEHKFEKISFADIEKGKADYPKETRDGWVGMIQHYFVVAWLPAANAQRDFYTSRVDKDLFSIGIKEPLGQVAPGATRSVDTRLLIAPQDQRMLAAIAPGLDLTVDYGWLTVIAKPIFWLLQFLHRIVGNWGWSIILLTLIIKTIFFPLQAASYRSMARMKAVTPRLMQLRERYGDDRAKLNQAMMELYKEEKINPLGGCLPIVVQIPVFISLYWVLLASVEMRNAPWALWIHDLAAPDPYYVLPLIMAGTMFLQTRMNPTPPDPVQAKVMMVMPIVFSVMFFFFPSGLVLYWLVNNIYSIAQQWFITRKLVPGSRK